MILQASRKAFVLAIALGLMGGSVSLLRPAWPPGPGEDGELELQGVAWDLTDKSSLSILIVPNPGLQGWRDSYLSAAHHAITEWMECIESFQARYGYAYLQRLRFEPYILGLNETANSAYDITISWASSLGEKDVFGRTSTIADSRGRLQHAAIVLSLSASVGGVTYWLNEVDMQNVVGDELGHALGIGHSNIRGDLMYRSFSFLKEAVCHSTLDIYGLAMVYEYLATGSFLTPTKLVVTLEGTGIVYGPLRD